MTKKDYIAVARIIKDRRPHLPLTTKVGQDCQLAINEYIDSIASDLCEVFITDNPRFDRQRFMDACH